MFTVGQIVRCAKSSLRSSSLYNNVEKDTLYRIKAINTNTSGHVAIETLNGEPLPRVKENPGSGWSQTRFEPLSKD